MSRSYCHEGRVPVVPRPIHTVHPTASQSSRPSQHEQRHQRMPRHIIRNPIPDETVNIRTPESRHRIPQTAPLFGARYDRFRTTQQRLPGKTASPKSHRSCQGKTAIPNSIIHYCQGKTAIPIPNISISRSIYIPHI